MRGKTGTRKRPALGLLTVALLTAAMPANPALAVERAPMLLAQSEADVPTGEKLRPLGSTRGSRGVSASDKWLQQARIGGLTLNLRLFTPAGDAITYQENLRPLAPTAPEMDLELVAAEWDRGLMLEVDQHALDVLGRVGVVSIVVADGNLDVRERYEVEELCAIRELFALGENELLCLGAENDPVSVVSEDGVRRQLTL